VRPAPPSLSRSDTSRVESGLLIALFATAFVLRSVGVFRYAFDSDEAQHLHVAWAYGHGFLPYRDVFDNHTPLFHLAMAPLVALVGERAEIHFIARFAMFYLQTRGNCLQTKPCRGIEWSHIDNSYGIAESKHFRSSVLLLE
jgi:hypothetical protein